MKTFIGWNATSKKKQERRLRSFEEIAETSKSACFEK